MPLVGEYKKKKATSLFSFTTSQCSILYKRRCSSYTEGDYILCIIYKPLARRKGARSTTSICIRVCNITVCVRAEGLIESSLILVS